MSRLSAAALGLVLAACAASAPDLRAEAGPIPAAVPAPVSKSTDPQEHSMIANATTAAEIGRRVLKLIDSIHGVDDLAPTRIEQVTGMKVDVNPDDRNEYGFGGKLTDAWSYNLLTLTETDGGKPNRLMFSFDDQTHADADMAPICALDFDAYAKALTDAGFTSSPAPGEHGSVLYWDFARGGVSVNVYVRAESAAKPKHACVSSIVINA